MSEPAHHAAFEELRQQLLRAQAEQRESRGQATAATNTISRLRREEAAAEVAEVRSGKRGEAEAIRAQMSTVSAEQESSSRRLEAAAKAEKLVLGDIERLYDEQGQAFIEDAAELSDVAAKKLLAVGAAIREAVEAFDPARRAWEPLTPMLMRHAEQAFRERGVYPPRATIPALCVFPAFPLTGAVEEFNRMQADPAAMARPRVVRERKAEPLQDFDAEVAP